MFRGPKCSEIWQQTVQRIDVAKIRMLRCVTKYVKQVRARNEAVEMDK